MRFLLDKSKCSSSHTALLSAPPTQGHGSDAVGPTSCHSSTLRSPRLSLSVGRYIGMGFRYACRFASSENYCESTLMYSVGKDGALGQASQPCRAAPMPRAPTHALSSRRAFSLLDFLLGGWTFFLGVFFCGGPADRMASP